MLCAARTEKRLIPPNSGQIGCENAHLERARPSTAAAPPYRPAAVGEVRNAG